jgi:tRNA U38,U39,U40 pseudouridine synthase TruA
VAFSILSVELVCDSARSTAQRWFRYHQIRKMLGLAFLTQRRSLPAETIDLAFADRSKLRCAIDASHVAEECNIPKWPR